MRAATYHRRGYQTPEPALLTKRMADYWMGRMVAAGMRFLHTEPIRLDGKPTGKWLIVKEMPGRDRVYIDNRELAKSYIADLADR